MFYWEGPAKRKRMAQRQRTANRNPHAKHFTNDELSRILAQERGAANGLDAALDATRVLLDRIICRMTARSDEIDDEQLGAFLKLAAAHNDTAGRIAALMRARTVIRGDAADTLSGHLAAALDQLSEQWHVEL